MSSSAPESSEVSASPIMLLSGNAAAPMRTVTVTPFDEYVLLQTLAHPCGKSHVHNLEPEDLVALTVEAAAMARVPLAGTAWIPGG